MPDSSIRYSDSQEAKPYKNDPEIVAMTNLVEAYMRNEIRSFEKLLKQNSATVPPPLAHTTHPPHATHTHARTHKRR